MRYDPDAFSILFIMKAIYASLVASFSVLDFINSSRVLAMIETFFSKDVVLVIMTGITIELIDRGESLVLVIRVLSGEENSNLSLDTSTLQ